MGSRYREKMLDGTRKMEVRVRESTYVPVNSKSFYFTSSCVVKYSYTTKHMI